MRAQLNKLANFFWEADPIAQLQYEYDQGVEQLKEGRQRIGKTKPIFAQGARRAGGYPAGSG